MIDLQQLLTPITLAHGEDKWTCIWGEGDYTTKQYYSHYFREIDVHQSYKWLWESKVTMKIKVFGWLLLSDRLNTRNMLKRRHYNIGTNFDCLMCAQHVEETVEHLFFIALSVRSAGDPWASYGPCMIKNLHWLSTKKPWNPVGCGWTFS